MSNVVIRQPQGKIIVTKTGKAQLRWNPNFSDKWEGQYDEGQKYLDDAVLRFSEPFMPRDKGVLIKSGRLFTKIGSGLVRWETPYSRYLYKGKVMVGRKPKRVTAKDLKFKGGPKRGAFWFTRMMEVHGKRMIARTAKIAGGNL